MKQILSLVLFAFLSVGAYATEEKKVCVDQVDAKTKKTKQVCKKVKIHKKLEVQKDSKK